MSRGWNHVPLIHRLQLDEATGCWNFRGSCNERGYGHATYKGKRIYAHRLAAILWLHMAEDDPRKVLHRCDNPRCFNPKHLLIGTQLENIRDGIAKGRIKRLAPWTVCARGHLLSSDNVYLHRTTGSRQCKTCARDSARERWRKLRGH